MQERSKRKNEKLGIDPLMESVRMLGDLENGRFSVAGVVLVKNLVFPLIKDDQGLFCVGYGKDLKQGIPVQHNFLNPGSLFLDTDRRFVACQLYNCVQADFFLGEDGKLLVRTFSGSIKGIETPAAVLFNDGQENNLAGNVSALAPDSASAFRLFSGLKAASEFETRMAL